jgi:serine/threonine-protein kinase
MTDRQRIEDLFEQALDRPESERGAWLETLTDREAARRVAALLDAHSRADGILDRPGPAGPDGSSGQDEPRLDRLGPYRVMEELGRGGMGVVYLARREDAFMRRVALKVVRPTEAVGDLVERFEAERQIMASLSHPNIAQLLDGGLDGNGRPYLVMEYVDGLPITDFCAREGLSLDERLTLFRKVCAAVEHAHHALVIHRDLKPSNILVTMEGEPKLLDFGVARVLHPVVPALADHATRPDGPGLTLDYASPEQLRGEPLTTASDVYALGVLLYQLLSGHRPFEALDPSSAARVGVAGVPEPPSARAPDPTARRVRGDLDAIALKALRPEPGRRYASVGLLSSDIEAFLAGRPVGARNGGRGYRVARFMGRHRLEVAAIAMVVASLVAGLGVALAQVRVARAERDRANQAAARAGATADFLVGLYESGSLGDASDTLSARAMLTRGLAEAGALADAPEVQARLYRVVGRAYGRLGDYAAAEGALRRAHDLAGDDDALRDPDEIREVAEGEADLADMLARLGRYEEARRWASAAFELRRRSFGPLDPDVATSLLQRGMMAVYFGQLAEADSLARLARDIRTDVLGPGHPRTINAVEALSSIRRRRGDVDGAEALLREAMTRRRETQGPEAREYAIAMVRLATLLTEDRDEHREAEALYRRALEIYPPGDPEVGSTLGYLGEVLAAQGRHEDAIAALERAVEERRMLFGPRHDAVAGALHALGNEQLRSGDRETAEDTQREALGIWSEALGPEHVATAYALCGLAEAMLAGGAYEDAEVLARRALSIREAGLAAENLLIPQTEAILAGVLTAEEQRAEAESMLLDALARMRSGLPETHRDVRAVHARLAVLYDAWGRDEEAARHRAAAGPPSA